MPVNANLVYHLQDDFAQGRLSHDPMAVLPFSHDVSSVPCSHAQAYIRPLSSTDAEKVIKRGLSEVAKDDEQLDCELSSKLCHQIYSAYADLSLFLFTVGSVDVKRLRASSPNGELQIIQPAVMCPICNSNTASARCPRGTCKKCCLEKNAEEETAFKENTKDKEAVTFTPVCEMHLEKVKKEQEKREKLKAHRQAKKERAREIQETEKSQKEARKVARSKGGNKKNDSSTNGHDEKPGGNTLIDVQPPADVVA